MSARLNKLIIYHKNNIIIRHEHILVANRTIALQVFFKAFMSGFNIHTNTNPAFFAMEIVYIYAFSYSAYSTVLAMINILGIIVPVVANRAKVFGKHYFAICATTGWSLFGIAFGTQNRVDFFANLVFKYFSM